MSVAVQDRTLTGTRIEERMHNSSKPDKKVKLHHLTEDQPQLTDQNFEPNMIPSAKKTVRFSDVTVREYPMIVGDNPAVSCGPPVTIDWEYNNEQIMSLDAHCHLNPYPRRKRQMLMPLHLREFILIHTDCKYSDILKATNEATNIRIKRMSTLNSSILDRLGEFRKTTTEKIKRFFKRSKRVSALRTKGVYDT